MAKFCAFATDFWSKIHAKTRSKIVKITSQNGRELFNGPFVKCTFLLKTVLFCTQQLMLKH